MCFFQDVGMEEAFSAYPEIVCIDATYKLTEFRIPVYILLVEDGMGLSEIAGVALLATEDAESLQWLFDTMKLKNPTDNIRVFMADKDLNERQLIKECFPHVIVLICLFHTLRTFKREVTAVTMGISKGNVEMLAEIFQEMAYLPTMDHVQKLKEKFYNVSPPIVSEYLGRNTR